MGILNNLFRKAKKKPEHTWKTLKIVNLNGKESDPADEIRKHKQLLDDNIIMQEDFDKKKAQLLGI